MSKIKHAKDVFSSDSEPGEHSKDAQDVPLDELLEDPIFQPTVPKAVSQSRLLEEEGNNSGPGSGPSSSPPVVTEGPGATPRSSSAASSVEVVGPVEKVESMEVDKSASDVPMTSRVPSDEEPQSDASPVIMELVGFGPHVIEALNKFHQTLAKHAVHRRMGIPKVWSKTIRTKKTEEMKKAWAGDINSLIDACFIDRNITFKEDESIPSTQAPSEQSTTSSPEASKCPCAVIHAALLSCPVGRGHRELCEVSIKKPFAKAKKKLTYTEASKTGKKGARSKSPVQSSSEAQSSRGGRRDTRRDFGANKRRNQSHNRSLSPPRKDARGYGGRSQYYQDFQSVPRPTTSAAAAPRPSADTIPSAAQFRSLMSIQPGDDIRLRQPGHGLQVQTFNMSDRPQPVVQPPEVTRAQLGQPCVDSHGNIEWHRMPLIPPGLPAGIQFKAYPHKGHWRADFVQTSGPQ
jgi:hypothetical protein